MEGEFSKVTTPDLVAEITTLAGHLNAANARFLALIAELDRRRGWAEWGVKSCAHWLNWKCGIDLGAAREKVRVAHALEKLPRMAATMAEGRISYAKVRAMTRVADATNEDYLLNIALCGTASHVEDVVRGLSPDLGCCGACRGKRFSNATSHSGFTLRRMVRWCFGAGCRRRWALCSSGHSRRPRTACRFPKTFLRKRLPTRSASRP